MRSEQKLKIVNIGSIFLVAVCIHFFVSVLFFFFDTLSKSESSVNETCVTVLMFGNFFVNGFDPVVRKHLGRQWLIGFLVMIVALVVSTLLFQLGKELQFAPWLLSSIGTMIGLLYATPFYQTVKRVRAEQNEVPLEN